MGCSENVASLIGLLTDLYDRAINPARELFEQVMSDPYELDTNAFLPRNWRMPGKNAWQVKGNRIRPPRRIVYDAT